MRPEDRERVVVEVVQRVLDRWGADPRTTEQALFDTLYEERRRLEDDGGSPERQAFYDRLYAEATHGSSRHQRELLRELVQAFAAEVAGHFDPRVYKVATTVLPHGLNILLNTLSPLRLLESLPGGGGRLTEQVHLEGEVAALKALAEVGTTILVPTHVSNLDSILMGYAIHRMGLPPYIYGAGLNLFSNQLIGWFMHHLGAYKVDRRKKAEVYKDVLKAYASATMELGYHNLFFPGGTRSRSGSVERHLKLGLLGTGLDTYVRNLQAKRSKPDVFVVPCTINYQLVLEAETLIDDHLAEEGRSRYIIEDDEFSRPRQVLDFVQKLFSLNSAVRVRFGGAIDVFGNRVDETGRSLDDRGREVKRSRYVLADGVPAHDPRRDAEYTRDLATAVVDTYRRDTVLASTHVLSRIAMDLLREANPSTDLFRLLRTGGVEESWALPDVYRRLDRTLKTLRKAAVAGEIRLDPGLAVRDPVAIVGEALAHLGTYHRRPALERKGDRLFHRDRNLLLYYGNRVPPEVLG